MNKIAKILSSCALAVVLCSNVAEAGAVSTENTMKVNDVITSSAGTKEIVVKVEDNGNIVTVLQSQYHAYVDSNCVHDYADIGQPKLYTSDCQGKKYCYCTYQKQKMVCRRCKQVAYSRRNYIYYKHSYGLLGKKCKKCGRAK